MQLNLELTKQLIYENCAERIRNRIKEKNVTHKYIYESDPKIISRIINCDISEKRNPYLIQDAVLYEITQKLEFNNKQEVLWGTYEEIEYNLIIIFQRIILDILSSQNDLKPEIDDILCTYVPYARYSAYQHILFETKLPTPDLVFSRMYNRDELGMKMTIDAKVSEAINHIFSLCRKEFKRKYFHFTSEMKTFSKWDKKMAMWIAEDFMGIIKPYTPRPDSLGMRIKRLLISDYSLIPNVFLSYTLPTQDIEPLNELLQATEKYVANLEKIYENCDKKSLLIKKNN